MGKVYDLGYTVGCMENLVHDDRVAECDATVRKTPHVLLTHLVDIILSLNELDFTLRFVIILYLLIFFLFY